jgi:hypothetical protein
VVNDSIFSIESKILEVKTTATAESELGPLKYLSKLTGIAMDRIINWYILVIIFVFDPLAIALVIAANFAFAQLTKRKETPIEKKVEIYDDLEWDEMKEWEEASLTDLQDPEDLEWDEYGNPSPIIKEDEEPNENLKQAAEEYKKQNGVPVMVDPKTGKFFYEEQDSEPINLDLDNDGVVEEEELLDYVNDIDLDKDGIIDLEEAKKAGLNTELVEKFNSLKTSLNGTLPSDPGTVGTRAYINQLKQELLEQLNKKNNLPRPSADPDNTITY